MVSIALVDARKTSLTGVQNSKKKSARRYAARGRCSASSLGLLFMVSIALVDARKTSLTGVQNSKKKSARRYAARGRCSASSLGQTPPWKKARSAPDHFTFFGGFSVPETIIFKIS